MNTHLRVAINGFGRIGRLVFRLGFADPDFEFVALNDLGNAENLTYLLQYDSVYRQYEKELRIENKELGVGKAKSVSQLVVDGKTIPFFQEKDPGNLPWQDLAVDLVIEATGAFESYAEAKVHLAAGAKRVLLTAPAKDEDGADGKTVLMGVNEGDLKTCLISSNGSCTTNSAHPVVQILHEKLGIKKAMLSTVHAYTATQGIVDGPSKGEDFRRGRAAASNIVPSTTGAAVAVTRAVKELAGKFDGIAFRVPVLAGSVSDIIFVASRSTTVEEVNAILTAASHEPRWNRFLKVISDQIVSSDIIGERFGAVVDLAMTRVVDGDLVKVLSWYDNEMGYTQNLLEHARAIKQIL